MSFLRCDSVSWFRSDVNSFQTNLLAGLVGFLTQFIIFNFPLKEILLAPGFADMFYTNMNSFDDLAVADYFLDLDAQGSLRDIKDHSGAAMVITIGHPLLNCRINNNVDIVASFEVDKIT